MSKKKITNQVLKKIKSQDLKPIPKWRFVLQWSVFWLLFAVSILVGAMAVSVIVFSLMTSDLEFYRYFGRSFAGHLVVVLPYFWILAFGALMGMAYWNYRHTQKGYRGVFVKVVGVSLVASTMLGVIFAGVGVGKRVDALLLERVPAYERVAPHRAAEWNSGEEGRLGGKVLELVDGRDFVLRDLEGSEWDVSVEDGARMPRGFVIEEGQVLKLVGEVVGEGEFQASGVKEFDDNLKKDVREKLAKPHEKRGERSKDGASERRGDKKKDFVKENLRPQRTR